MTASEIDFFRAQFRELSSTIERQNELLLEVVSELKTMNQFCQDGTLDTRVVNKVETEVIGLVYTRDAIG